MMYKWHATSNGYNYKLEQTVIEACKQNKKFLNYIVGKNKLLSSNATIDHHQFHDSVKLL